MMDAVERWKDEQRRGSEKNLLAWLRNDPETVEAYALQIRKLLNKNAMPAPHATHVELEAKKVKSSNRNRQDVQEFIAKHNIRTVGELRAALESPVSRGRRRNPDTPERILEAARCTAKGMTKYAMAPRLFPGVAQSVAYSRTRAFFAKNKSAIATAAIRLRAETS